MITAALLLGDTIGNHMSNWGAGWWILMVFLMVVFWGLVIVGIVWLVRFLAQGGRHRESTAAEILYRRFALGEVSVEEYEERRRYLSDGATSETAGHRLIEAPGRSVNLGISANS